MWIASIILLPIILLIGYVLFVPLVLIIDSERRIYRMKWGPAHMSLISEDGQLRYRLKLPFWRREGALMGSLEPSPPRTASEKTGASVPFRSRSSWRPSLPALIRSFRVRRLHWSLDTGDALWNAWLFPWFHLLRLRGRDVSISFTGRNELELIVENDLYRLLKAMLFGRTRTSKKTRPWAKT